MATVREAKRATIDDLYETSGKAELVNGEVILMAPTGFTAGYAAGEIFVHLRIYARQQGSGWAVGDNVGFVVNLPHRKSFSPDVAFWTGENPGMKFCDGAPVFAVEVRSENDYGPAAEREMAAKRADYFAAGAQVVWDVDLQSDNVVGVYRATVADNPVVFRRGEMADAEPAVPGWSMPVDDLFVN